jgi:hypothetical protein
MKNGKSLLLWGDNQPYFYETNLILNNYFDGMKLNGDYYGGKIISANKFSDKENNGF